MEAKYKIIYEALLNRIKSGEFKVGETLPKEFSLMEEYSVSRDTIRKSLRLLSDEGYIHANKGVGSIVLDTNRFDFQVGGIISFKELCEKMGKNVNTEVIMCQLIEPDKRISDNLSLNNDDKVWMIERVREINNEKIILDIDFLNASIIPYMDKSIAKNSLYDYIESELKLKISYADKEITCQNVNNNDRKLLDLNGYNLLVNVDSHTYLSDTRLFQFTRSRHRPDKFCFKNFAKR